MEEIHQSIIHQAANGDINSFKVIYDVMKDYVYTVAYRITSSREDAEEVTQDVFVNIYKNLRKFKFQSSLKTWVYRIATNTAINRAKKNLRGSGREVALDENIPLQSFGETLTEQARKENNEELVKKFLDQLNPDQRACIMLRDSEGLSYEEIAETLKININTVRSRLKRAREKLLQATGKEP